MDFDLEDLWTTAEAARHAKVSVATIWKWVERGHLDVAERDRRGRLKLAPLAVARAEAKTREHAGRTVATAA